MMSESRKTGPGLNVGDAIELIGEFHGWDALLWLNKECVDASQA